MISINENRKYLLSGFKLMDLFNPYYIDRKTIYDFVKWAGEKYSGNKILDFGCGNKPYEKLFPNKTYVGCDVRAGGHSNKEKKVDVYYDGHVLPFETENFDTILSTQVLEHVENIEEIFRELVRVCKKNGHMIITVPFCFEEHEKPYDFRRFTSYGIRNLFEKNGIKLLKIAKSTNYKTTIMFMRCMYYDNKYRSKKTLYNFFTRYASCVIYNFAFKYLKTNTKCNNKEDDMTINFFVVGKKI